MMVNWKIGSQQILRAVKMSTGNTIITTVFNEEQEFNYSDCG